MCARYLKGDGSVRSTSGRSRATSGQHIRPSQVHRPAVCMHPTSHGVASLSQLGYTPRGSRIRREKGCKQKDGASFARR